METKQGAMGRVEIQTALAIGICLLLAKWIPNFQAMTSSISVLLCMQGTVAMSRKLGITRLIITAIGGAAGVLVTLLDNLINNEMVLILLVMAGILLTLFCCKLAKVPDMSVRIGGVNFILVALTLKGVNRFPYALYRFISTLGGVVVVLVIAGIAALIQNQLAKNKKQASNVPSA